MFDRALRLILAFGASLAASLSLAGAAPPVHRPARATPWAELAVADLRAVHDALAANHPGAVDPENPYFADWLERGLKTAMPAARAARGYSEYQRALLLYTNGFRDTHIVPQFLLAPAFYEWPGFLVRRNGAGRLELVGNHPGALLVSCDGLDGDALQRRRLDLYHWNSAIPHERDRWLPQLFLLDGADLAFRVKSCVIEQDGKRETIALSWSKVEPDHAQALLEQASGRHVPPLGIRKVDGEWLVSIPTFNFQTAEQVAAVKAWLAQLA